MIMGMRKRPTGLGERYASAVAAVKPHGPGAPPPEPCDDATPSGVVKGDTRSAGIKVGAVVATTSSGLLASPFVTVSPMHTHSLWTTLWISDDNRDDVRDRESPDGRGAAEG